MFLNKSAGNRIPDPTVSNWSENRMVILCYKYWPHFRKLKVFVFKILKFILIITTGSMLAYGGCENSLLFHGNSSWTVIFVVLDCNN